MTNKTEILLKGCGEMFQPFGESPPETSWRCGDKWNGKPLLCKTCKAKINQRKTDLEEFLEVLEKLDNKEVSIIYANDKMALIKSQITQIKKEIKQLGEVE